MPIRPARFASLLAIAIASALALSGCDRGADAPADAAPGAGRDASVVAPAAPEAEANADAVDATRVVDRAAVAGAGGAFDVRAFAGTFGGEGLDLKLAGDGTYVLTARAESAGADLPGSGTWSVEDDGTRIRLDPDSKDEADRVFAIAPGDALVGDDGGQVLRRVGD